MMEKLIMAELLIKRLGPHAQLPVRVTAECAGYDLASAECKIIGVCYITSLLSARASIKVYLRLAGRS